MEPPASLWVADESTTLFITFTANFLKCLFGCCKVVSVDEVLPGVVGRVDIDQFDLPK